MMHNKIANQNRLIINNKIVILSNKKINNQLLSKLVDIKIE